VDFPKTLLCKLPESKRASVLEILSHDPRPSYQNDPDRVYGLSYGGWDIRFTVKDKALLVQEVTEIR